MRVLVRRAGTGATAALVEADDFTAFSVEVDDGVDLRRAGELLAGQVRFASAQQAWVDRDWLVRTGGFASGPAAEAFAAMVAYAARKGWVDPGTHEIAAHVTHGKRT
ncbi:hypothetical protein ACFVT2_41675 [Streptomyces sp. NPDC058000]|uniref:hypothetical protein n=1 Tax=Streptomyces sp. NPDC058000 TaxID=3346299 RepID=UPI0036DFC67C